MLVTIFCYMYKLINILSPGGMVRKHLPRGPLDTLSIYWCRKRFWGFQIYGGWEAFLKFWKCFIPLREASKEAPKGSNWYSFHFIGVGNGTGGFKFTDGFLPFWKLENVLSPGGMLRKQLPVGVQLILFPFYWCRKRYWGFQIYRRFFAILKTWKCVIWWDGGDGGDGWTDGTGGTVPKSVL